ncbi:LCP family protein required for cell wall assembly [Paenibacillus mucilaginosus]|uniref:LCP family protein n=1 Tax=Paenibacillus mucilaginosus TaxID=61624 RepID=UPI003D2563DC
MFPSRIKSKKRITLRSTVVCLAVLGAGAAAYAGYLFFQADKALQNMSVATPSPIKTGLLSGEASASEATWRPMSFLLTGVDSRGGSGGSMNTDVLMLVTLNPESRKATVVSIPRDLEMKPKEFGLSAHKANYYYAYYYNQDKNSAIPKTKELFSDMFGLPIDYMAAIDFDGFRDVVDELGGIETYVDMDMRYVDTWDGTDINLKQGLQTLNGKQTLDFLRYRKSNRGTEESSDTARNERQQKVLDELLDKMTSFSGIAGWGGILEIAGKSVKTDIPADELRRFILSFQKLKPDSIEFIHLNGRWESPYIVPKEEDLAAAIASLRAQLELPADTQTASGSGSTYSSLYKRFGIDRAVASKEPASTANSQSLNSTKTQTANSTRTQTTATPKTQTTNSTKTQTSSSTSTKTQTTGSTKTQTTDSAKSPTSETTKAQTVNSTKTPATDSVKAPATNTTQTTNSTKTPATDSTKAPDATDTTGTESTKVPAAGTTTTTQTTEPVEQPTQSAPTQTTEPSSVPAAGSTKVQTEIKAEADAPSEPAATRSFR